MADMNKTDFREIVRQIENYKILLPDFQREFVWKDEEKQKRIVASVLARMPIGSILLLQSKPDEYSSKKIGCKDQIDPSSILGETEFLLDGQQRITVLTNVFSNVIHDACSKISDLISPSLKRRFFLRIPKWGTSKNERDLFGVYNLNFKYQNPDSEDPEFLSGDIFPFIECITFLNDDKKPYNPQMPLGVELDDFCLTYDKGYLIPLFLLAPSEKKNKSQTVLRLGAILKGIASHIGDEISNYFVSLDDTKKEAFIEELFIDEESKKRVIDDYSLIESELENMQELWKTYLENYLSTCVKNVSLNKIVVKEEQRARAIDIYENLNLGGVSLNTFDLIMARVAKVSKDNFKDRIVNYMNGEKKYNAYVLPDVIEKTIGERIKTGEYNATISSGCYYSSKAEINGKYIDAFLDVLSLYCYNKSFDADSFKLDNMKKDQILRLSPEEIDGNCERVCNAIDRALFFFQTRCGIRNIQEINYSLMIVLVATVFLKDEYFEDKKVHGILEAWYWSVLFSGEYDKDQNVTMINNLQAMIKSIRGEKSYDWIISIEDGVFSTVNFSDKEFLLLEKVDQDRYPKMVMRAFMCQYLLSKTYADMFDSNKRISVFCDESNELEAHHIVPLGSAKKIGESTQSLRKDPRHICNSPLNFVLITKKSNKDISDDSLDEYANKICPQAKSALYISSYTGVNSADTDDKIHSILEQRFSFLEGDIKQHINDLLPD